MNIGLAPCVALLNARRLGTKQLLEAGWEIGRLVLAPEVRGNHDLLRHCLFITLVHLIETRPIDNLFAVCSPLAARLYRRLGLSVLVPNVQWETGERFSIMHGPSPAVLHALAGGPGDHEIARRVLAGNSVREARICG